MLPNIFASFYSYLHVTKQLKTFGHDFHSHVRESVSARKDAGARKGVGVEIVSVGKRKVFWAILKM